MTKTCNRTKIFLIIIAFLYIFEYTVYGQQISGTKYIIMLVVVFSLYLKDRKLFLNLPKSPITLCTFFCFCLIPFGQALVEMNVNIGIYAIIMNVFIAYTYGIGKTLNLSANRQWFATMFSIIGTLIVAISFIIYPQNLFNISSILSNFRNELNLSMSLVARERSAFGFIHANTLGGICLGVIVALTMINVEKKESREIRFFAIIFILLIMLNTGSRASIYGTLVYFTSIFMIKLYFKSSKRFKFIIRILLLVAMIYVLSIVYSAISNNFDLASQLTSGRLEGWVYDISKMKKDGVLLFGYGLYNPREFFSRSFSEGMIVDNWYVYMIVNIGFLGFSGCILLILSILIKLLRMCKKNNDMNQKVLALFLANIFHAMAEKAFITPADPISYFMLVEVFATLCSNKSKEIAFNERRIIDENRIG